MHSTQSGCTPPHVPTPLRTNPTTPLLVATVANSMELPVAALALLGAMAAYVRVHIAWHAALAHGVVLLDVRPSWTLADADALVRDLAALPSAARGVALGTATGVDDLLAFYASLDLVFPAAYAGALVALFLVLAGGARRPGWELLAPVAAAVADWCENLAVAWLARGGLEGDAALAGAVAAFGGRVATPVKWLAVAATVLALGVHCIARVQAACPRDASGGTAPTAPSDGTTVAAPRAIATSSRRRPRQQ